MVLVTEKRKKREEVVRRREISHPNENFEKKRRWVNHGVRGRNFFLPELFEKLKASRMQKGWARVGFEIYDIDFKIEIIKKNLNIVIFK